MIAYKAFSTLIFFVLFVFSVFIVDAQDSGIDLDSFDDIDSLFEETAEEENAAAVTPTQEIQSLSPAKKKGFSMTASYSFTGGYFPGWTESPWYWDEYGETQSVELGVIMSSSLGLNYQISDAFGVSTVIDFSFPSFALGISVFSFEYVIKDAVFIKAGKFSAAWGISRNFPYTNLLARAHPSNAELGLRSHYAGVDNAGNELYYSYYETDAAGANPSARYTQAKGDTYTAKVDVPIGIGGVQVIATVQDDFFTGGNHKKELIAFGGTYNSAFRWADITVGALYQPILPLRTFLSAKTTLGNTELYGEFLAAIGESEWYNINRVAYDGSGGVLPDAEESADGSHYYYTAERRTVWETAAFSGSLGAAHSFFSDKLYVNAEVFYNGENSAYWTEEEDLTRARSAKNVGFPDGLNAAFNVGYRADWFGLGMRFYAQCLWGIMDGSAQFVPAMSISPLSNLTVSFGVPMVLGSRDGVYYRNNVDRSNRPFSIALAVTFSGSHKYSNLY